MTADWPRIKEALEETIQIIPSKKPEVNREREADRSLTINWLMDELKKGPMPGGTIEGENYGIPDFCWTFGSYIWTAERKAVLIRDDRCKLCGVNPSREVHHIRPKYLGGAKYAPRNLIGLCPDCHREVHRTISAGVTEVVNNSLEFVQAKNAANASSIQIKLGAYLR